MPPERATQRDAIKSGSSRRRRRGDGEIADWSGIDPAILAQLITNVTAQGAALTFGYTKDRGAYALHFADGADRWKDYIPANGEADVIVAELVILWRDD